MFCLLCFFIFILLFFFKYTLKNLYVYWKWKSKKKILENKFFNDKHCPEYDWPRVTCIKYIRE